MNASRMPKSDSSQLMGATIDGIVQRRLTQANQRMKQDNQKYCSECGELINVKAEICYTEYALNTFCPALLFCIVLARLLLLLTSFSQIFFMNGSFDIDLDTARLMPSKVRKTGF